MWVGFIINGMIFLSISAVSPSPLHTTTDATLLCYVCMVHVWYQGMAGTEQLTEQVSK